MNDYTEDGHEEQSPGTDGAGDAGTGTPGDGDSAGTGSSNGWQTGSTGGSGASGFLSQLQTMIDNLATQSAPVIREIGAKAAELAAVAADQAGPLAQRAGTATQNAASRVAVKSRDLAAELRRAADGGTEATADEAGSGASDQAADAPTGETEPPGDAGAAS